MTTKISFVVSITGIFLWRCKYYNIRREFQIKKCYRDKDNYNLMIYRQFYAIVRRLLFIHE